MAGGALVELGSSKFDKSWGQPLLTAPESFPESGPPDPVSEM